MNPSRNPNIPALERALIDINKFEQRLKEAIRDEKDAQTMYANIVQNAEMLGRTLPEFEPLVESARTINGIIREEATHERKFIAMLSGMGTIRQRVKDKITEVRNKENEDRRKKQDEERKKQDNDRRKREDEHRKKLSVGYYGPYSSRGPVRVGR